MGQRALKCGKTWIRPVTCPTNDAEKGSTENTAIKEHEKAGVDFPKKGVKQCFLPTCRGKEVLVANLLGGLTQGVEGNYPH